MSINLSRHFVLRKLHQLSGIFPLGFFLVNHFYSNWAATHGPESFKEKVEWIHSLPYLFAMEIGVIFVPLLYHSIYGLIITYESRPNNQSYGHARNWMYLLQRISGVILVAFIAWHLYEFRFSLSGNFVKSVQGIDPVLTPFGVVQAALSNPLNFAWYVVGIGSVVFHLANGLWLFLVDWGIAVGPRAQRALGYVCVGLGIGLFIFGLDAATAFIRPGGIFAPLLK